MIVKIVAVGDLKFKERRNITDENGKNLSTHTYTDTHKKRR